MDQISESGLESGLIKVIELLTCEVDSMDKSISRLDAIDNKVDGMEKKIGTIEVEVKKLKEVPNANMADAESNAGDD